MTGLLFFNWPLLSIPAGENDARPIGYLLSLWLVFIFSLWTYCRNQAAPPPDEQGGEGHS